MQIQRPGLAAFCIKKRDTAGPLIDLALIEPQGGNFTDPQSCPVAEREDGSETAAAVLVDELLEHKTLLLRKLGWSNRHDRWAVHRTCRNAAGGALIHRPLAKPTQSRNSLTPGPTGTPSALA